MTSPTALPSRPRRGYADGPYGQIHFHDTGAVGPGNLGAVAGAAGGGKPLVLLHQAPVSARQYEPVYPRLAALGVRAIGLDMPGFGMSDPTSFVPKVEDYAKIVPAVLDHLGIAKAAILGHHTGALVATEAALQFPDRIDRLILNGPLPLEDAEREQWLNWVRNDEMKFTAAPDGSHIAKLFQVRWQMAGGTVPGDVVTRYISETLMGFAPFWYGHHAAFVYNHNVSIPRIRHRTLILTNTGDQIYEHAKVAHRMRPEFEFVALEGGGIDVTDQLPDAWAQAVAKFVTGA